MKASILRTTPFSANTKSSRRFCTAVASSTARPADTNFGRREACLSGAALTALSLVLQRSASAAEGAGRTKIDVNNLNSFQRKDERAAFLKIVEGELKADLKPEDAPDTLRVVLHDAGTYDVATETGGLNGSIFLQEELNRPENKSLSSIVQRLKKIKAEIDKKTAVAGYGPISYADLEVVAAKVANERAWAAIKIKRGLPSSGDIISTAFGASWPLKLGRIDTDKPDPAGRLPSSEASVQEITEFFAKLNNRSYGATGFFAPKPIFDERQVFLLYGSAQTDVGAAESKLAAQPNSSYNGYKKKYDQSRETVTRTDYEVDLIDYFNQLISLGAKFNPDAYLIPIEIDTPKF